MCVRAPPPPLLSCQTARTNLCVARSHWRYQAGRRVNRTGLPRERTRLRGPPTVSTRAATSHARVRTQADAPPPAISSSSANADPPGSRAASMRICIGGAPLPSLGAAADAAPRDRATTGRRPVALPRPPAPPRRPRPPLPAAPALPAAEAAAAAACGAGAFLPLDAALRPNESREGADAAAAPASAARPQRHGNSTRTHHRAQARTHSCLPRPLLRWRPRVMPGGPHAAALAGSALPQITLKIGRVRAHKWTHTIHHTHTHTCKYTNAHAHTVPMKACIAELSPPFG